MTRAVAELIKGVHLDHFKNFVITIKQANGLVREVPNSDKDIATPVLIEAILRDMGIKNPEIREAAKQYCLDYIKGWNEIVENPEIDGITIGELITAVGAFEAGWKAVPKKI